MGLDKKERAKLREKKAREKRANRRIEKREINEAIQKDCPEELSSRNSLSGNVVNRKD